MTNTNTTLRQLSAFVPIILSIAALALVLSHVALFGAAHQADEGAAAHLWQLLMAMQVPIIAFFAIRYIPQQPRQVVPILALQLIAILMACAPVAYFHL